MTDPKALADGPIEPLYRAPHGWTCFHCNETFMTPGAARDHFGADPIAQPGCQIKVGEERGLLMEIRRLEDELARYRAEDSDADRACHALRAETVVKVREAEEAGYAKALADVEAGKVEPEHAQCILTALRAAPTASYADGFRDGLEEAASLVDDEADALKMCLSTHAQYEAPDRGAVAAAIRALPVPEGESASSDDDPVTMAIAALRCADAAGKDLIAVSGFAEVALAYLTGHGGDYTAYREAEDAAIATRAKP